MVVGIADIEEEGIGNAMTSGAALDIGEPAGGRHQVEQVDDVERRRHPEGGVVQARAAAVGKGDVVHAALAMGPGGPETSRLLVGRVFRYPEADLVVEGDRFVDIGREAVEVVDAQRFDAAVERVFLVDWRQTVHLRIEFERDALRVTGAKGA
ncbi:hypothetical protein D3C71_1713420 [compost metagenome]